MKPTVNKDDWPSQLFCCYNCSFNNVKMLIPLRIVKSAYEPSQAHQAGAYPGFCGMKRQEVLLPPGWDASPSQGYPQHYVRRDPSTWVERGTVRVKCLAQEHNTMSPARARTRTALSGDEHTRYKANASPISGVKDQHIPRIMLSNE